MKELRLPPCVLFPKTVNQIPVLRASPSFPKRLTSNYWLMVHKQSLTEKPFGDDNLKAIQSICFSKDSKPQRELGWTIRLSLAKFPSLSCASVLCHQLFPRRIQTQTQASKTRPHWVILHPPEKMGSKQRLKDSVRRLLPLPLGRASLHSVLDMEHHPCFGCQETPTWHQPQFCFLCQLVLTYILALKWLPILWQVISRPCNLMRILHPLNR